MGIRDKFLKKSTDKIGNKMLKIDPVVGKGRLPKNKKDLAKRRERAEELVRKKALLSSSASVIPIPGLDFGVDLKLMKDIIEDINKIYGLDHKEVNRMSDDVKERVLVAASIQGSQFIGRTVSKGILKMVVKDVAKRTAAKQTRWFPVVGQAIAASISYYFMKKLGDEHIDKCENVAKKIM
ncbi:DUF697 domain-containing protein [Staphylococcus simulans]|uniref:DUF697 domain-containing protein n=1 Tax=Staphylococcus simulans TaxID=1286 RepID=UPI000D1F67F3|nr:DUF697 domain-containing protein [Staphylococcus simulans]MDY5059487.1 DUF697 domain-containing protein [Staphylococcus simulans]PTJ21226.1 DUF697 domain-containing protein [Staphylococcus simulans]